MIKIGNGVPGKYIAAILTATLVALLPLTTLAESDVSILYHEPLVLLEVASAEDGSTERLTFDAFGRRFVLLVESSAPSKSEPAVELIKARLADTPESWARLTLRDGRLSGFIHDLDDTYIIEPRSVLTGTLITTGAGESTPSIIYRLADTLVAPGLLSCDARHDGARVDGKTALAGLTAELGATTTLATTGGNVARVGVIADSRLFNRLGSATRSTVEQIFLTVDGIFSEQVGIGIEAASILVSTTETQDPVSSERVGAKILNELSQWRISNQTQFGITHLITSRSLINGSKPPKSISGISFLGVAGQAGVCAPQSGASISEWLGSGLTALVVTHEIAHNLGAPHDGQLAAPDEPPNPCESVPQNTFLMSPSIDKAGITEFSQCSVREMEKVIAAATCLRPASQTLAVGQSAAGGGGALQWSTILILIGLAGARRKLVASRQRANRSG